MRKIKPRRRNRSVKVCAFQVKKATGLTAVRSSRLPSTRQYTHGAVPELGCESSKLLLVL